MAEVAKLVYHKFDPSKLPKALKASYTAYHEAVTASVVAREKFEALATEAQATAKKLPAGKIVKVFTRFGFDNPALAFVDPPKAKSGGQVGEEISF